MLSMSDVVRVRFCTRDLAACNPIVTVWQRVGQADSGFVAEDDEVCLDAPTMKVRPIWGRALAPLHLESAHLVLVSATLPDGQFFGQYFGE